MLAILVMLIVVIVTVPEPPLAADGTDPPDHSSVTAAPSIVTALIYYELFGLLIILTETLSPTFIKVLTLFPPLYFIAAVVAPVPLVVK